MIFKKLLNNKVKEIAEQRKVLTETFPYTDWKKIPYTQYDKFLSLKDLIGECGVVWTNAFGRSNTEPDGQRNFLKDYSGNGRDIELFNFGYSKQSGFNGYVQDFRKWNLSNNASGSKNEKGGTITNISESSSLSTVLSISPSNYVNSEFIIETDFNASANLIFYKANYNGSVLNVSLVKGKNIIRALTEEELAEVFIIALNISPGSTINITQIPEYQGALVSDGVDDYGQCMKDFALPDDYTVVAMREIMNDYGCVASRMNMQTQGAFIFENQNNNVFSYGAMTVVGYPKLFSYQTKNSYNGTDINAGTSSDDETFKLKIFHQSAMNNYLQAALYSFGIFSRTLTTEELALVEDCMYLELEYNTNILDGIEYYDILDARYRSNEEAEDKRNRWVGRFGKLHMTLNNYGYSQMSGWNGWPLPKQCTFSVAKQNSSYWLGYMGAPAAVKTNSWGIRIVSNPTGDSISLIYISSSNTPVKTIALNEGVVNIIPPMTEDFANLAFSLPNHPVGSVVEFEQIPLYGGALVSDGVDDYAVSDKVIDEAIGGVVAHAEILPSNTGYIYSTNWKSDGVFEYSSLAYRIAGDVVPGNGQVDTKNQTLDSVLTAFSRVPASPENRLFIGTINETLQQMGNTALYQLRLIKNQPTETQLEVIKQQVLREHNDYLKEMGWK